MKKIYILVSLLICCAPFLEAQEYFLKKYSPFDPNIPSPEEFLGYPIGQQHTRHDQIVAYLKILASISEKASVHEYGKTYEGRSLVILTVSASENMAQLEQLKRQHLAFTDPDKEVTNYDEVPVFINLGYNVHGNEPSCSEAALLTAYTLVASNTPEVKKYLRNAVVFIDPVINPDGRDRHTQWANSYKGNPLVTDPQDAEHNEYWPGGRTNHYWFDLNRDWLLAVHPESRGKLNWYHQWYPNVVTDFHEMGTNSTYFFEPMKANGSLNPIMPKENYIDLNNMFGAYFAEALDSIGSFYFTKEVFDGTYPGYGSSYPDLQGGLGLLFEQASSRGHAQKTAFGEITFPFTIRNQFLSSITTVKAAVENKAMLRKYQQDFFKSALKNAARSKTNAYTFKETHDKNRLKAFIDKLLIHKIKVYRDPSDKDTFIIPTQQPQYRMVQSFFETYKTYRDSVFYDASAWSVANFYHIDYKASSKKISLGEPVKTPEGIFSPASPVRSDYAYIVDYSDYNIFAFMHYLQSRGVYTSTAFKSFSTETHLGTKSFNHNALIIPVTQQSITGDSLFKILNDGAKKYEVAVYSVPSGYSKGGIDLGSRYVRPLQKPKAFMLIGDGVRSYEAGEVWHLLDQRVHMPVTKIPMRNFHRVTLEKYTTMIMVSGSYHQLDSVQRKRISDWVSRGNTLISIGTASKWLINKKMVKEKLTNTQPTDYNQLDSVQRKRISDYLLANNNTLVNVGSLINDKVVKEWLKSSGNKKRGNISKRQAYADAPELLGKERLGGAIFKVSLDVTHPLGFGYTRSEIPVYKNNEVWLAPSKNMFSTVAQYTSSPHLDGFISTKNLDTYLKPSASLIVSALGKGRVILFADNPNFRGSWYGTNRLFLNALFLGNHIRVPK